MTSMRPYLIRAIREWILANGMTPQMLVDASMAGVQVPGQHVVNDRIILNFSDSAVQALSLGDDYIEFNARFGGRPFQVHVPVGAVLAVAARESGMGMEFSPEPQGDEPPPGGGDGPPLGDAPGEGAAPKPDSRPTLRVVK